MRVLFTTSPGWGHLHPLVPLAQAFLERGDEVAWAAPPEFVPRLERAGFTALPAGLDLGAGLPSLDFSKLRTMPDRDRSTFLFMNIFGGTLVGPMLASLASIVRRVGPDVIIREAAEFAAPIAAAKAGIPCLTHAIGGPMPQERLEAIGGQLAELWRDNGLEPQPYAGAYGDLYIDIYPRSLEGSEPVHIPRVQPLRPVAFATEGDEPLPSWRPEHRELPLIYVTFGTAPIPAPVPTVLAALRQIPARVVVTLGPRGDPAGLGPQPPTVHVARYIPQTELLADCAAVVSHAGSGTFLATLERGLPQLCLPRAADQFHNAEACERVGAGIALEGEAVTEPAIAGAVERLLADTSLKAAAERVAGEMAAMPDPARVADLIAAGERGTPAPSKV